MLKQVLQDGDTSENKYLAAPEGSFTILGCGLPGAKFTVIQDSTLNWDRLPG